jgi:hypothetical protein
MMETQFLGQKHIELQTNNRSDYIDHKGFDIPPPPPFKYLPNSPI